MNGVPKFEWITKGRKYTTTGSILHPNEIGYKFFAPFTDVGEPYGDLLREFFEKWKKNLIYPSFSSIQDKEYEGKYTDQINYTYFTTKFADFLSFRFSVKSDGVVLGLNLESHQSQPLPHLDTFLDQFGELAPEIEYIAISDDFLTRLPSSWQQMSKIERIYLRCPKLSISPVQITSNLNQLREIYLHSSPIKNFPTTLCNFPELTDLTLEACPNLRTLPPEIAQLRNLKRLEIINCSQFTHLPPEIGQLTNLWGLDLVDLPHFAALPSEIGGLTDLRVMTLSQLLQLRSIPSEIGHCAQLRALRIDHLPFLHALPDELGQCHMLHELKIDGSVFLDALPLSLVQTAMINGYNLYKYFHDKVIVPPGVEKKISVYDQRFLLIDDPIESLDEWIRIRGELGLDVESAQVFKTWFIKNIPPRAYPWFTGFGGGHQPARYEDIQWLLTHPQFFTDDILDWVDQQVEEWKDHDRVDTMTREDWERLKYQEKKK